MRLWYDETDVGRKLYLDIKNLHKTDFNREALEYLEEFPLEEYSFILNEFDQYDTVFPYNVAVHHPSDSNGVYELLWFRQEYLLDPSNNPLRMNIDEEIVL